MTDATKEEKSEKRGASPTPRIKTPMVLSTLISIGMLFTTVMLFSDELASYALDALRAVALKVIPVAFPFMILSELLSAHAYPASIPPIRWLVVRLLSLPKALIGPIIIGSITGFPIGAKLISEERLCGRIDKESAERALALANNPSPAFVVGTVGIGIFGDAKVGAILLGSIYTATLFCGLLFRSKSFFPQYPDEIPPHRYNFVDSVKTAASSILYMSAFICVFYTLSSFIASFDIPLIPKCIMILPTEITGAVIFIGKNLPSGGAIPLSLTAFALGFGGISVACQISALVKDSSLTIKKYLPMKLTEGLLSAGVAYFLGFILGI